MTAAQLRIADCELRIDNRGLHSLEFVPAICRDPEEEEPSGNPQSAIRN